MRRRTLIRLGVAVGDEAAAVGRGLRHRLLLPAPTTTLPGALADLIRVASSAKYSPREVRKGPFTNFQLYTSRTSVTRCSASEP